MQLPQRGMVVFWALLAELQHCGVCRDLSLVEIHVTFFYLELILELELLWVVNSIKFLLSLCLTDIAKIAKNRFFVC